MSRVTTGPTENERAEYIDAVDWEVSDFEFVADVGGTVRIDVDQIEVDDLLKAADMCGEPSTAFIKLAAMERIRRVLNPHTDQSTPSAAGGS